jgi:hypothetical protein
MMAGHGGELNAPRDLGKEVTFSLQCPGCSKTFNFNGPYNMAEAVAGEKVEMKRCSLFQHGEMHSMTWKEALRIPFTCHTTDWNKQYELPVPFVVDDKDESSSQPGRSLTRSRSRSPAPVAAPAAPRGPRKINGMTLNAFQIYVVDKLEAIERRLDAV